MPEEVVEMAECPLCHGSVNSNDLIAISRQTSDTQTCEDECCHECRDSFCVCTACDSMYDTEAEGSRRYGNYCYECSVSMERCQNCNDPFEQEDMHHTERYERGPFCDECIEAEDDSDNDRYNAENDEEEAPVAPPPNRPRNADRVIFDYSYKMPTYPFNKNGGRYMLGIEYEMEVSRNHDVQRTGALVRSLCQAQDDRGDYMCLKSDGSLQGGFELVTRPASLPEHKARMKNFFDNMPPEIMISERCGLHIHVNKGSGKTAGDRMSKLQVGKMRAFVSSSETQHYITKICGRAPNTYCQRYEGRLASKRKSGTYESEYERIARQVKLSGKYQIWNETEYTMEFRAPAATKDWNEFWSRVEMAVALCEYSAVTPINKCSGLEPFVSWLERQGKLYPCLGSATAGYMSSDEGKKRGKK